MLLESNLYTKFRLNQFNLVDNLISRGLRRIHRITCPINYNHAGAGIHGIAPVTRCLPCGVIAEKTITRTKTLNTTL